MSHLAPPVDQLIAERKEGRGAPIDLIVVGSGYGGAVAALRCAEAKLATCVLERGNEYQPGDFPRDVVDTPAHFRIDGSAATIGGYDDALFDLHVGEETAVLVGNGLGGGSLINANVVLRPDPRVFRQRPWPRSLGDGALDRYFELAEQHLRAQPYRPPRPGELPPKTVAFDAFARAANSRSDIATITVNTEPEAVPVPRGRLEPCIGCGDCVAGCNYGAKATLATTYIPEACTLGARFFTNATVLRVARQATGWRVYFVRTVDYRRYQRARARIATARKAKERARIGAVLKRLEHVLDAGTVILAAGSLGSTEILKRSEQQGLALSGRLGSRFSGNGDYLSFGYGQNRRVDAVGWGATGSSSAPQPVVGPTITRIARFRDEEDVTKSFVVQDASVPGALADVFHELVTTASILPQLNRFRSLRPGNARDGDPIARVPEGRTHTQILLTIGHDDSGGSLCLADNGRIRVEWPSLKLRNPFERYDTRQVAVEALGGVYLGNPAWTPIPRSMEDVLSGAKFRGRDLIVHPLGGCPMADDAADGVVNDIGAVYEGSAGTAVHPGLHVLDGAIIPTSLGANPLLTITALAERAAAAIAANATERRGRADKVTLPAQPPLPDLPVPALGRQVPVELREIMRGELLAGSGQRLAVSLEVRFPTPDVHAFLADPQHRFGNAEAGIQVSAMGRGRSLVATTHYPLARGTVTILEPIRTSFFEHLVDTVQVLLTWFIERGRAEILEGWRNRRTRTRKGPGIVKLVFGILRMAWHAADRRRMRYAFRLTREGTAPLPPELALLPDRLLFQGEKRVFYAAEWRALRAYIGARLNDLRNRWFPRTAAPSSNLDAKRTSPERLERRNLWQSMTEFDVSIRGDDAPSALVASGRIMMAPVEMLDEDHAARVEGETSTGLLGMVGYPLLFARYLLKCRVWDFRLPSYDPMPANRDAREAVGAAAGLVHPDQHPPRLRPLLGGEPVEPLAYRLDVPLRLDSSETLALVLWRYKNTPQTRLTKDNMQQCKSILLVHAFAQSALSFAEPSLETNLAEYLHRDGWDVWMLEHRLSIALEASQSRSTMDEIAAIDIPAAFDTCLTQLRNELPEAEGPLQIYALAQCVGSAALAMSILSGKLAYDTFIQRVNVETPHYHPDARQYSKVAGVVFSQFTPYVIGHAGSQFRSFLPTLLRDLFGLSGFDFAAPAGGPSAGQGAGDDTGRFSEQTATLVDRLLATYPIADEERCPGERQGAGATQVCASCRRMAGVEAPLFSHSNLSQATHDRLPLLLGYANIDVFVHARKCVECERLVNADGLNVYVTQYNIQTHLHMPVALLHGIENELFSVGSSRRSYLLLRQCFTSDHVKKRLRLILLKGYGHLDWLIGKRAHQDCYPKVKEFLDAAWATSREWSALQVPIVPDEAAVEDELAVERANMDPNAAPGSAPPPANFLLALPVMGPLVGHVARDGDDLVANIFIRPQDMASTLPSAVVFDYTVEAERVVTVFNARNEVVPLPKRQYYRRRASRWMPAPYGEWFDLRYAVCPIRIPLRHFPANGTALQVDTYALRLLPTEAGFAKSMSGNEGNPLPGGPLAPPDQVPAVPPDQNPIQTALTNDNFAKLKEQIDRVRSDSRSIDYRRGRTLRSSLSQLRLRRRPLEDGRCELRRPWVEPMVNGSVSLLATCCRYPGFLIEQHRVDETFGRILDGPLRAEPRNAPSALFLLGDQVYADATAGFFDMTTPIEKFNARYEDLLTSHNVRRVVARIPTYMSIDDHEISDSWDSTQRILDEPLAAMAFSTARVYQWAHSADARIALGEPLRRTPKVGFLHQGTVGGVVPFIVLDTRTHRWVGGDGSRLFSKSTWTAIEAWLDKYAELDAPKIIASSSPIAPGFERYLGAESVLDGYRASSADNWQGFNANRLRLFQMIADRGIRNLVFLSGDYHCAGIADVTYRDRALATAIVVPPAYAPLAYANAKASGLAKTEVLGDYKIALSCWPSGQIACTDGSGFAHIAFTKRDNAWKLRVRFDTCNVSGGSDIRRAANWQHAEYEAEI